MSVKLVATTVLQGRMRTDVLAAVFYSGAVLQVQLVKEAFTPGPDPVFPEDVWEADFIGYAGKTPGTTAIIYNPPDGRYYLRLTEPAGGWNWITTALTNLPQTIYGLRIYFETEEEVIFSALLQQPVLLEVVGATVAIGDIWIPLEGLLFQPA